MGPTEHTPVSEFIQDELNERGWTPLQFAVAAWLDRDTASGLLAGTVEITEKIAISLSIAFDTSVGFWRGLAKKSKTSP